MSEQNTAESPVADDAHGADRARVAHNVRTLLESRGIEKNRHAKDLAEIIGCSVPQAYKFLQGRVEMAISQLRTLADNYRVPLDTLLPLVRDHRKDSAVAATLLLNKKDALGCHVVLGAQIIWTDRVQWLAYEDGSSWIVARPDTAPKNKSLYFVEQVYLATDTTRAMSVAVLDDSPETAFVVCTHLASAGFRAVPFFNGQALIDELKTERFDAYILDWLLQDGSSEPVLQAIRALEGPATPIYLLTGQWNTGRADQSEIKRAIMEYRLAIRTKPIEMDLLVAELYAAMDHA